MKSQWDWLNEAYAIKKEVQENFDQYDQLLAKTRIEFSNKLTSTAGKARYSQNVITLSWPIFCQPENQAGFRNTMLHEIAHIVLGPGYGHNRIWKYTHRKIGGNGKRTHLLTTKKRRAYRRAYKAAIVVCACGYKVRIGPIQHKRLREGVQYRHKKCGQPLAEAKEIYSE